MTDREALRQCAEALERWRYAEWYVGAHNVSIHQDAHERLITSTKHALALPAVQAALAGDEVPPVKVSWHKTGARSWVVEVTTPAAPILHRYFTSGAGASACATKWCAALHANAPAPATED